MRIPFPRTVALVLLTQISIISCQQFDTITGCIPSGTKIVLTKTLSCPCYLGYSLYSPIDSNLTTDFLLLPTEEYNVWKRNHFTNSPSVIHQHSIFNASTTSTVFKTPTETSSGSFTFIIRTHAFQTDCSIRLLHLFTQIPRCTSTRGNKIIGGKPIPRFTKHMVILESETGYCSGTLISNQHILTAAHCNAKSGKARIGNRTSQEYDIESFHTHPSYIPTRGLPKFDIAVVTLSQPINHTDGIPLPYARGGNISGDVTITGFGQTHERIPGTAFRELRAVNVEQMSLRECGIAFSKNGFPEVARELGKGMLCLGGNCGDSCYGDSGGGGLVKNDGNYVVVGVVSAGIGCGRRGLPGIYTNVMEFGNWVESIVGYDGVILTGNDGEVEIRDVGDIGWIGIGVVMGLCTMMGVLEWLKFGRFGWLGWFDEEEEDDDEKNVNVMARRWFHTKEFGSREFIVFDDSENESL